MRSEQDAARPLELLALRCGYIDADSGLLDEGKPSRNYRRIPVMVFVVRTTSGWILFDTGMCIAARGDLEGYYGRQAKHLLVPMLEPDDDVSVRLEQASIGPDQVDLVVNSHLHFDHCGMNGAFAPEKILVRELERRYATERAATPVSGYVSADLAASSSYRAITYSSRYPLVSDGSIALVSAPGHTPGHQCLYVRFLSGKELLACGDAVYSAEAMAVGRPPGGNWDNAKASATARAVADFSERGGDVLIAHDPGRWASGEAVQVVHAE